MTDATATAPKRKRTSKAVGYVVQMKASEGGGAWVDMTEHELATMADAIAALKSLAEPPDGRYRIAKVWPAVTVRVETVERRVIE